MFCAGDCHRSTWEARPGVKDMFLDVLSIGSLLPGKLLTGFRKRMKQDLGVVSLGRLPLKMDWSCVPC